VTVKILSIFIYDSIVCNGLKVKPPGACNLPEQDQTSLSSIVAQSVNLNCNSDIFLRSQDQKWNCSFRSFSTVSFPLRKANITGKWLAVEARSLSALW